jgi:hypothetical protein
MTMQAEPGIALDAGFFVNFKASIDALTAETARLRKRQDRLSQGIHPFIVGPMPLTITSNAGTLAIPNLLGPQMSNYWDIHRISVTGYSAGTIAVYLGQNNGDLVANFVTPSAGSIVGCQYFGKAHILLSGNDSLYFGASGITAAGGYLTVSLSGVEIAADLIGDYLS